MSAIFLSYRRDDSSGYAGRLFDNLAERFDREQVFMDIETLEPGMDFVDGIDRAIESCGAVIAMIGPNWLKATDSEGRRRLNDPNDFIRLEIYLALKRGVRVIPVLVHNARMPPEDELPEPLRPLCRLQACEISDNRWEFDVRRLIGVLEPLVAKPATGAGPAPGTERIGTQPVTGGSPAGGAPPPRSNRAGLIAAVTVLLVGALGGGGWWFSQQTAVAPQGPILAIQPSPPPQDESTRTGQTAATDTTPSSTPAPTPTPTQSPRPGPEPATAVQVPATSPPAIEPQPSIVADPRPALPPPPASPVEPPPAEPSDEELAQQQKTRTIAELLGRAETDLAELRLSRPAGDNAYERYRQVLELDPDNRDARRGLLAVTERYRGLVEEALGRGAFDTAQRHLESARALERGSDWLVPMQNEIQRQRRQAARPTRSPIATPTTTTTPGTREAGLESCLADCEHQHRACRQESDPDVEANCLRDRAPACEQRYEECMSDSSKLFVWGRTGLESECAGVHAECERSAAKGCANAPQTAIARCDRRFEQCSRECRSAR